MIDVQWFTENATWVKPAWARENPDGVVTHTLAGGGWVIAVTMDGDRGTDGDLTLPGWVVARIAQGPSAPPPGAVGLIAATFGGRGTTTFIAGSGGSGGRRDA